MITYNHERYIAKAIDSILTQNVSFDYEIVIGEDASTDKTRNIILNYKKTLPDKFRLLLHDDNIGMMPNFVQALNSSKGKYIALLEGDDYWTDPLKLQKQVDFLDANPEYSLCSHRYSIFNTYNNSYSDDYCAHLFNNNTPGLEISQDSFFNCYLTKTLSVVFRKKNLDISLVSKYKYYRDTHLFFHLLSEGKGFCFNFNGGVYNKHVDGVYSPLSGFEKTKLAYLILEELYEYNKLLSLKVKYFNAFSLYVDSLIIQKRFPFFNKTIYGYLIQLFYVTKSYRLLISKVMKLFFYPLKYCCRAQTT